MSRRRRAPLGAHTSGGSSWGTWFTIALLLAVIFFVGGFSLMLLLSPKWSARGPSTEETKPVSEESEPDGFITGGTGKQEPITPGAVELPPVSPEAPVAEPMENNEPVPPEFSQRELAPATEQQPTASEESPSAVPTPAAPVPAQEALPPSTVAEDPNSPAMQIPIPPPSMAVGESGEPLGEIVPLDPLPE